MADPGFCVFILSHGRPHAQETLRTLKKGGYSGAWYIVLDDEDATAPEYAARYGASRILTFSKEAVARTMDTADLSPSRTSVVYARNACFDLARKLGVGRFLELDDDYNHWEYRYEQGGRLKLSEIRDLDRLFSAMLAFLDDSGAASVALAQGGDLIGGAGSRNWRNQVLRKAMNTYFCRTEDTWRFVGRLNDDVNTPVTLSHRGLLFFTTAMAMVRQPATQKRPGGMTGVFRAEGTYAKSFYPVMMCPSAVQVWMLPVEHPRIHHHVNWVACAPKILPESFRKPREAPGE